jgi:hypothetical protein
MMQPRRLGIVVLAGTVERHKTSSSTITHVKKENRS